MAEHAARKDLAERVYWTFLEGASAVVPANLVLTDWSVVKSTAIGALVAGAAAVIALAKGMVKERRQRTR